MNNQENKDDNYLYYVKQYFSNAEGGVIKSKELMTKLDELNKPFLEKHQDYKAEGKIDIGEIDTTLEYKVYKPIDESGESQTSAGLY